ncbi:MAG: hypothetical protein NZ602_01530, partial [Thermoguttaceae bacterium]|nr:hypothetical protein [Thermoguttaceae bacterium]MDW8036811.1 hypothetical protein [Thermoguttaceae bacterium]
MKGWIMRLTLRTLLAYMDGILEPEQAEILRKKIEESEFAKNLMERIREVTRRLRLGAPPVGEKGVLLDPNTVAEYLDNTLHGDRVPDFEKVCLESDIALAEVASCHQILTMILGEPAEIDPVTRQKMYQLLEQAAEKSKQEPRPSEPVPEPAAEAKREKASPGELLQAGSKGAVPEYLREPSKGRRFWLMAALFFLAGFITIILLGSLGVVGPGGPLGWLWVSTGPEEQQPSPEPSAGPLPSEEPLAQQPAPSAGKLSQPKDLLPHGKEEAAKTPSDKLPKAPLPEDLQKPPSEADKEKISGPAEKGQEKPKSAPPPGSPAGRPGPGGNAPPGGPRPGG